MIRGECQPQLGEGGLQVEGVSQCPAFVLVGSAPVLPLFWVVSVLTCLSMIKQVYNPWPKVTSLHWGWSGCLRLQGSQLGHPISRPPSSW